MKSIPIVKISSLEDALTKIDQIADTFRSEGLLKLQGHKLERLEQLMLVSRLGDIFSWNISTTTVTETPSDELVDLYVFTGGHSDDPNRGESLATDYLLDWHIEQVFYIDTFLAGFWNMYHIGYTNPKAGNTHFVDSNELYESLPDEDKDFLSKSIVIWDKPIGPRSGFGPYYTKALDTNKVNGKTVVRLETDSGCTIPVSLYLFDGIEPSKEQKDKFLSILSSIKQKLNTDTSIRYEQEWQQDDVIIVDLFRMYHAVTGGFSYGERKFHGTFTRPAGYTSDLYDSLEKL